MFSNGRKTIGLFIFNLQGAFQREICQNIAVRAEQLGYNLAVFSSFGSYGKNEAYSIGEMAIFDLPDYQRLAGMIIAMDTFNIDKASECVLAHIRNDVTCPVVSLREPITGVNNVLIDEKCSIEGITRHIIEHHGKKRIAFMTGPKGRRVAEERLEHFRKTMEEYHLPVHENQIFYGDFWKYKGEEACDWFLQDGEYPEAILCANDYMAMAVVNALYARGIYVPEDILVTGYDDIEESVVHSPTLTTVHVDFADMATQAVDLIDRHQEDDEIEDVCVKTRIVLRESCNCMEKGDNSIFLQRCMQHNAVAVNDNMEMQFSFMTIDFGKIYEIEKLLSVVDYYIWNLDDINNYFLCLREDIKEVKEESSEYSKQMNVRVALKNRVNQGAINIPFDRSTLIPQEFIGEEPQCYYFLPIHFQNTSFGYEAYSFLTADKEPKIFVRWNIAVSNAIENALMHTRMSDLIFELENMYVQDVLTGLYNRRGFEKYGRMQFSQARAKDSTVCVIGIDMDGLKPINDIYGHHEGDSALRSVGYAIQEAAVPGQIGARIGGDEFEVIFPCEDEDDVKNWIRIFERSLSKYNQKSGKPYEVHASWGYKVTVPTVNDTIESFMKESDNIMYRNKIENKKKRKEALR